MKALKICRSIAFSMLVAAGLAACEKSGPAETAGKKIDQAIEKAGEKMDVAADATEKLGEQVARTGEKIGVALTDTEITARVKAAIFAEPGLKTLQISVDTIKGVVTLTGSVDTQAQSDMAEGLAEAVEGVSRVDNRLALKSVRRLSPGQRRSPLSGADHGTQGRI